MKKNNIFLEDVDIPEVVQKKADDAFFSIKTERICSMKKTDFVNTDFANTDFIETDNGKTEATQEKDKTNNRRKKTKIAGILAAAACAAVIITTGSFTDSFKNIFMTSDTKPADMIGKESGDSLLTTVDNMFTLQVKAAESGEEPVLLTEGQPIPIALSDNKSTSWVLGADDMEGGILNYCISIPPLTCTGDNIKSITYSINKGAFQIVQPENAENIIIGGPENGESIVIGGKYYNGELNTGNIGGDYSEDRDGAPSRPFETVLYESFTLDYSRQSDEYTWINICNELCNSEDIISLLWNEESTIEEYNAGLQKMLEPTIITCTVHYTDNTSQSAQIKVDSSIMTRKDAGDILEPGTDPEDLEEKTTAFTFELQ